MIAPLPEHLYLDFAYALIGLSTKVHGGDLESAKSCYRKAILYEHPDKGGTSEGYRAVACAYDIVSAHISERAVLISDAQKSTLCEHPALNYFAFLALYVINKLEARAADTVVHLQATLDEVYDSVVKKVCVPVYRQTITMYTTRNDTFSKGLDELDDGLILVSSAFQDQQETTTRAVTLFIPIHADTVAEGDYVFEGMGSDSLFDGFRRGDIRVRIELIPHHLYAIDTVVSRYDLHASIKVSIRDYYYGRTIVLPGLNGRPSWRISYEGQGRTTEDDYSIGRNVKLFRGLGLQKPHDDDGDRGDLYVFFDLMLPTISNHILSKPHIRLFFEMIFGMQLPPAAANDQVL
jgi:DnaJ C terminal domain